jgi:hypothetical protein
MSVAPIQIQMRHHYRSVSIDLSPGLPDFCWCVIPKPEKMYQINTKFIGIFGLTISHLATLSFTIGPGLRWIIKF